MDLFTAVDFDGFVTPSQVPGGFGIFYVIVVPGGAQQYVHGSIAPVAFHHGLPQF